jgi:transcriptional regulator with XRE-family HTH domain
MNLKTPQEVALELAARAKARRLALNLTQEGLAKRSGVTAPSLKRFEHTGLISLESLLKLALVLDALEDFEAVFKGIETQPSSLDELLNKPATRRKGRIT